MFRKTIPIFFLLVSPVFAQGLPPVGVQDEGGTETKPVFTINCVGAGISCAHSGKTATLTVSGSGSATITTQEGDVTLDTATDTLDFGDGFDLTEDPAGETNVALDLSEITIDPDLLTDEDQGDVNISSNVWQVQEVQNGAISEAADVDNDLLTHAQIADSDQADTKCFKLQESDGIDDTDDLTSIWANKTANDFLITEIWCETDVGTVTAMFQVDDGTPADVDGTDIVCDSDEQEDTSLDGDTTVAAGEELDWAITSVATTPADLTACFTGNWVD